MDLQQLQSIIEQRDFSLWQDNITSDILSSLSLQDYQELCVSCVQTDWGMGVAHLWQESQQCIHSWYWQSPSANQNPGNAFFRACQHAKVQCVRELAQHMGPTTLLHGVLLGSHSATRPLRMTQNRVKTLGYLARELKKTPIEQLSNNMVFVQAVLGNNHLGVIKSFHDMWDKNTVWTNIWNKLQKDHIDDNKIVSSSAGAIPWIDSLELLWQVTDNPEDIPDTVKRSLMEVATHPQNTEKFPYIHSELTKKEILEAITAQRLEHEQHQQEITLQKKRQKKM